MKVRAASFAGSWYLADPNSLRTQINQFMDEAKSKINPKDSVLVILVPHAGLVYSGLTASHSYYALKKSRPNLTRIILMGPSHRHFFEKDGIYKSSFSHYDTVFGALEVECIDAIEKVIDSDVELREHSLEMQTPFIKLLFPNVKIVPILISGHPPEAEMMILKGLLNDAETVVIVSSDFCHWGPRFGYMPFQDHSKRPLNLIEKMDRQAMEHISSGSIDKFDEYIKKTSNTICGLHPIRLAMRLLRGVEGSWNWLHYEQSGAMQIGMSDDCSVSYVSGVFICEPDPSPSNDS